ncbi:protein KASH5-like isoform X2 [Macrosteles quadrilineatus]|uniref:protein KASH5-like isoform X2 n=1 Tax=Macrosteles quadrilineatus TaxID=74068 RepID=UPI0023E1908F|nr:protein KASH5-like isoform X2 [Macrosteles quadrilineatus]
MPSDITEKFLEVLNTTFSLCDKNGTGLVEINRLIDFLISQEPSWHDNETVREEFFKVLHNDLNNVISKDEFIKSLLEWFEASLNQEKNHTNGKNSTSEAGKCSNSSSGISEPSEITSGSSTNSMEEIHPGTIFVTDEQTFTNEVFDETPLNDSENSQTDLRFVKVLQSEITTLLRKNEYLENINESLLGQVSYLEDAFAKKEQDSEDLTNQLSKTRNHLEVQIQKYEEAEDRINIVTEENKSMSIQLSHSERENCKLNSALSSLEEKLESSLNENKENHFKIKELKNKLDTLTNIHNDSIKHVELERESFNFKENEREIAWEEVMTENQKLRQQLDSNVLYTEDLKHKLKTALKELSDLQIHHIKNIMETDSSCSILSGENAKVFMGENFFLGDTVPFKASLLAELKDEVELSKKVCSSDCKHTIELHPSPLDTSNTTDVTSTVETAEKATMTNIILQQVLSMKKKIISKIRICQRKGNK